MEEESNTVWFWILDICHKMVVRDNNSLFHNTDYDKTCIIVLLLFLGVFYIIVAVEDLIITIMHYLFMYNLFNYFL